MGLKANAVYAQSGGVTAVINASFCGVLDGIKVSTQIDKFYVGLNGILGILQEELIDVATEQAIDLAKLMHTPGGAFGSCRYKLQDIHKQQKEYARLIEVFKAHNIRYFFYNGGGDSQDTAYKVSQISAQLDYPIVCIGIPKTIDNDLAITDNCPGYGSVAKYVAISTLEASLDVASMAKNSTKVFVLEVMGRHTGWIAAASGVIAKQLSDPPHLILLPEVPFIQDAFLARVNHAVSEYGYAVIVAAEGIKTSEGNLLSKDAKHTDLFGHAKLGGIAPLLANMIQDSLQHKTHWAVADYLQRSARHIASKVDVEQAYALGKKAVELAITGHNAVMPIITRISNAPYRWELAFTELSKVANIEKLLPPEFISSDGYGITSLAKDYILPLIQGEDYPPYIAGLPDYVRLNKQLISKLLPAFNL